MFWLVETKEQLQQLPYNEEIFVELVLYHDRIHPALNCISCIYIRGVHDDKGYMLPLSHSEALSLQYEDVLQQLQQYSTIFVRDKKQFLYYFNLKGVKDINLIDTVKVDCTTQAHELLYRKNHRVEYINTVIPISKHYERCEEIYNKVQPVFTSDIPDHFKFYNNDATKVFWYIEKQGIAVEHPEDCLDMTNPQYSIEDGRIYTHYNLYTTTTRPSNAFNGINFAGLNKEDGTRKFIVPQNDFLLEIDINGYHPTLIANIIDYDLGNQGVYEHFAEVLDVPVQEAKELMFRQLYGGISKEYTHLTYFKEVDRLINDLWDDYREDGYVKCLLSDYKFDAYNIENINKQKLFNYYIQNLETSNNIRILKEILPLLTQKTKLVLYTYDAFLFDVSKQEKQVIQQIVDIFEQHKLKVKLSYGGNYDSLRRL
jgi:hypothetical protein